MLLQTPVYAESQLFKLHSYYVRIQTNDSNQASQLAINYTKITVVYKLLRSGLPRFDSNWDN